jgi:HD-like signal output (HDOD) protein
MLTWLRRLLGLEAPISARPVRSDAPAMAPAAASSAPPSAPVAATPQAPATVAASPALSLDGQWTACLAEADALRLAHPVAAAQPDAAALLGLLAQEPDAVIRQLPSAARGAIALCDDPSLSRNELAARLTNDPALVQALLRMANSAAMGAGRDPVLGIAQALDRIGVAGAQAVILASCVDGLLSRPGGAFDWMASRVWSHMVRTAPLARTLAPAFSADADEAFAIALLHDVGKLVIFDRLSVLRASQRRPIAIDTDFMHRLLQLLHEPLGALAAQQWSMGERAASAIGSHHRRRGSAVRDTLAEVVFLAERIDLATYRSLPVDFDALWQQGQLTGSPARAAAALERLRDAA